MPLALLKYGLSSKHPSRPDLIWTPDLKTSYDVVIIGAGGHGLATAYHLAAHHGITDIAVLDRGWLAGGNTARNTTIVRSNYLTPEGVAFYKESVELFNLATDVGEKTNMANAEPKITEQLRARYAAFAKEAAPPKARPKPRGFKSPRVWGQAD